MIFKLFKSAAEDIPEWMPSWVKEHPEIKKRQFLSDVESTKEIPIENYRETIDGKDVGISDLKLSGAETEFKYQLLLDIFKLKNELFKKIKEVDDNKKGLALSTIEAIAYFYNDIRDNLKTIREFKINKEILIEYEEEVKDKGKFKKTIRLPVGTSVAKVFNIFEKLCNDLAKLNLNLKPFESKLYYSFSKRIMNPEKHAYDIVFTTNPQDILAMSSRSFWTSCQNLFDEEYSHKEKAVYSAISKFVGIIYLTNSKDFDNRGEEMLARSVVLFLEPRSNEGAPIIAVGPIYGDVDNFSVRNKFIESLSNNCPLEVKDLIEIAKEYKFPTLRENYNFDNKARPYVDYDEITNENENKEQKEFIDFFAAKKNKIYLIKIKEFQIIQKLRTDFFKSTKNNKKILSLMNNIKDDVANLAAPLFNIATFPHDADYKSKIKNNIENIIRFSIMTNHSSISMIDFIAHVSKMISDNILMLSNMFRTVKLKYDDKLYTDLYNSIVELKDVKKLCISIRKINNFCESKEQKIKAQIAYKIHLIEEEMV